MWALHEAAKEYNNTFSYRAKINFVFRYASEYGCSYHVSVNANLNNVGILGATYRP